MNELVLVLDAKAGNAEGPIWDFEKQLLYWVDIPGMKVHIYNPACNIDKAIDVGQYAGTVVARKNGGLLVALHNGFYTLDTETEKMTFISDPESHIPDNRFNDGKCDPAGRLWAGTMSLQYKDKMGSLYVLDSDFNTKKVLSDISISNGITWSIDKKTMYYIDTHTLGVDAFNYDLESGNITNRRTVIKIPQGMGAPDGMTIDEEGMLWVALWNGYAVTRWNPCNGEMLCKINVPAAKVSACTFGGAKLDELYITTARRELCEKELETQQHAGGIFMVKPGVSGTKAFNFNG